jgi:hypothetical protein
MHAPSSHEVRETEVISERDIASANTYATAAFVEQQPRTIPTAHVLNYVCVLHFALTIQL